MDKINPPYYKDRFPGVEPIQITQHLPFCLGSAVKYICRCGHKEGADPITDLRKAIWYLENEIVRLASGESNGKK